MPGCACFYLSTCLVSGSCVFVFFFFLFHRCFHAYPWVLLYHAVEANEGISISGISYCLPCRARSVGAKCNSSVWSLGESYISRSRTCGTKLSLPTRPAPSDRAKQAIWPAYKIMQCTCWEPRISKRWNGMGTTAR